MRSYEQEIEARVAFLKNALKDSGAAGFVYGNSGGKDSALVGILCRMASPNTVGLLMPCHAARNYGMDMDDGREVAEQFGIETRTVDLTATRQALVEAAGKATQLSEMALSNIAPRLRMAALYAVAASENRLVVGTGNRSEAYMGYFTKWGDGAHDINPIADLTVTDIYALLRHLHAPAAILSKAPSAGLFEGQTDEGEMGITYAAIDHYLTTGEAAPDDLKIIERFHNRSEHKRRGVMVYTDEIIL
ncbi:MAG: NAD(+) synthase [Oscillospiraceae bacterium]|jgi:NAD+ synthase|nr:NAD(+) synthase [Oscillospiraceae bacterium]